MCQAVGWVGGEGVRLCVIKLVRPSLALTLTLRCQAYSGAPSAALSQPAGVMTLCMIGDATRVPILCSCDAGSLRFEVQEVNRHRSDRENLPSFRMEGVSEQHHLSSYKPPVTGRPTKVTQTVFNSRR